MKTLDAYLRAAADTVAAEALADVRRRTPVRTGRLRAGWRSRAVRKGSSYDIALENDVPYAGAVESGHRQTPGRYVPAIGKRLKRGRVPGKHMKASVLGAARRKLPGRLSAAVRAYQAMVARVLEEERMREHVGR